MSQDPTQAEAMQKGQQVAEAGAVAAQESPPESRQAAAATAMRKERDRIGFDQLPDSEIDRIAEILNGKLIEGLRVQGAFDPPPEPTQAPAQNVAPPPPGAEEPGAATAPIEPTPAPVKRTFAHRFMGER